MKITWLSQDVGPMQTVPTSPIAPTGGYYAAPAVGPMPFAQSRMPVLPNVGPMPFVQSRTTPVLPNVGPRPPLTPAVRLRSTQSYVTLPLSVGDTLTLVSSGGLIWALNAGGGQQALGHDLVIYPREFGPYADSYVGFVPDNTGMISQSTTARACPGRPVWVSSSADLVAFHANGAWASTGQLMVHSAAYCV